MGPVLRFLAGLLLTGVLAACGGGNGPGSATAPVAAGIAGQPADQSVVAGTAATFTVVAKGATAYQWHRSTDGGATFTAIGGATAAEYTSPVASMADSGTQYRVVVSGASNSVTSSAAMLTVSAAVVAPSISVQPAARSIIAGQDASFSVTAAGTNLAYQWQGSPDGIAFSDLAGGTNATLTLPAVPLTANALRVRVVVSNPAGSVTSAAALLTVSAAQALPAFTTQPVSVAVVAPAGATFTATASGVPTPTLQWQRSTDGGATFADIVGETGDSFVVADTAAGDDVRIYRVVATNTSGSTASDIATLTVTPTPVAPSFTTQPASVSIVAGQSTQFTAAASGTPVPSLQWQLSTDNGASWSNINGATGETLAVINAAQGNNGRQFRAVASNTEGTVNSNAAVLTVTSAPVAGTQRSKVAAGSQHTCAIQADATVACWGYNSSGQIGSGNYNSFSSPHTVTIPENVAAVAAGGFSSGSSCALTVTGNLWCWGGVVGTANAPTAIGGHTGVRWVAVGGIHACFVTSDGHVYCWGNNSVGQLGNGSTTSSSSPVQVLGALGLPLDDVVAVAAGFSHSCALRGNGSVMCWGNNLDPIAGDIATLVPGLSGVSALAAGDGAPCAVLGNGTVACWGADGAGWTSPTTVPGLSDVAAMASGSQHRCAAGTNGRVRCWGTGLMGNGNVSEIQPNPSLVSGLADVGALAAGLQHTCALRSNGSLACWGSGGNGQLGQGDSAPRTTPTDVPGVLFAQP